MSRREPKLPVFDPLAEDPWLKANETSRKRNARHRAKRKAAKLCRACIQPIWKGGMCKAHYKVHIAQVWRSSGASKRRCFYDSEDRAVVASKQRVGTQRKLRVK